MPLRAPHRPPWGASWRGIPALFAAALAIGLVLPADAREYHVGPGQPFATVSSAPLDQLLPGDTVLIHWRPSAYHEKILLSRSGTAAHPIRIVGVPGPGGRRPVLAGDNADGRHVVPTYAPLEALAVVLISRRSGTPYTEKVHDVVLDGLDIQGGHPTNRFTSSNGATRSYARDASGIALYYCQDVTIRNCTLRLNGNGLFGKSNGDEAGQLRNILVDGNRFYANGVKGYDRVHSSYLEGIHVVYQHNRYGKPIVGALGGALKDRSAGTIVRYNTFEGGQRYLDLVEAQDGLAIIGRDPDYRRTFVYGNTFVDGAGDAERIVHYGGDSGVPAGYRKGTLYFAFNTVVIRPGASERFQRKIVFELSTNRETLEADDNILWVQPSPAGVTVEFSLMTQFGAAHFGANWVSPKWNAFRPGYVRAGSVSGTQKLRASATNDPGFVNAARGDFHLRADSTCRGRGAALPAAWSTIVDVYPYVLSPTIRAHPGSVIDLGAHRFGSP